MRSKINMMPSFKKQFRFYHYLLPLWRPGVLTLSLTGGTILLGLVNPYLAKLIVDRAYANKDLWLFMLLVAIAGITSIINGAVNRWIGYINRYLKMRVNFDLNRAVFSKLQGIHYGFFQSSSTGENIYKINYDIDRLAAYITETLPQFIFLPLKFLFTFAVISYLNWRVALFSLALTPLFYLAPYYITKRFRKALDAFIVVSQDIFRQLHEVLTHIQLIRSFGRENFEKRRYVRNLIERMRGGLRNVRLEFTASFTANLANRLISGLVICYGGIQLIKGRMTLGTLSAITLYISQLSGLQYSFTNLFQSVVLGAVSSERLGAILDTKAVSAENGLAREIRFSASSIEFRDVTFGYTGDRMVLEGMNFRINDASSIALVGPSGCGKTTIVNLLLRLYSPNKGRILIDGCDIRDIKSRSLYDQIGAVLQEPYLWNDTVEYNIRYGRQNASLSEVREAARIACIDGFIESLPGAYDVVIGENACKISEGQKQRIAIARAVIKRPKILILDEALSSIDVETADKIIDNIRNALPESTIIVVSHHLSTIEKMDLVYFLDGPDRINVGSHEDLLADNLRYQNYRIGLPSEIHT